MHDDTNMTVLSDSVFVEIGRFIPDVKQSEFEIGDACDDDNAGAACAAQ